jgi:hypothetical protein
MLSGYATLHTRIYENTFINRSMTRAEAKAAYRVHQQHRRIAAQRLWKQTLNPAVNVAK